MNSTENVRQGALTVRNRGTPLESGAPAIRPCSPSSEALNGPPSELRCTRCRRVLLRVHRDEAVYLGRVTYFRGEKAEAACPNCKSRIEVPLRLIR